ncbi:MAG TPA: YfhO family protein [Thermoanaerobaculia bacterium]
MPNLAWLYVGALYGGAIWLGRRYVPIRRRIAVLFYALTLLFFFKPMTGRYVNIVTDALGLMSPWSATMHVSKADVSNPEMHDPLMQMTPWADQVRKAWRGGHLPLWQDLTECGNPLLGNGQSAALHPFRLLALPLPLGYSMTAEAAMKVLVALTFTFLYCRRRGYGEVASAIAAISFGFSLFIVVWLHFSHTIVAAFLPFVFYSIDLLADQVTRVRFAFAAFGWAITVFGGHIETVAHIAFIAIVYVLWTALVEKQRDRLRFLGAIAGAGVVAGVISSPQLATLGEAVLRSKRLYDLHTEPYDLIPYSDFNSLFLFIQPRFFGWIPREPSWGPGHAEAIAGFAGVLGVAGCVAVLANAALARRWREVETFFALSWLAVFAALANIQPMKWIVSNAIPFTAHARLRILMCWLGAVLAAAIVERVRDWRAIALGVASVAAVVVFQFTRMDFPDAAAFRGSVVTTIPAVVVLTLALLLVVERARRIVVPLLALAVLVDVWLPGYFWNPVRPAATLYPRTPLTDALQRLERGPWRMVGIDGVLFPGTSVIYDFQDIRQHDPVANASYVNLLQSLAAYDPLTYYAKWYDTGTHLLDFLNVRWVVTDPDVELFDRERYVEAYHGADGRIYENRSVLPRFFAAESYAIATTPEQVSQRLVGLRDWRSVVVLKRDPGVSITRARVDIVKARATRYELRVESAGPALIASSIPYWPGWVVTADGGRLEPLQLNSAFLGFLVPAGSKNVRVLYRPMTFYLPAAASLIASASLAFCLVRRSK